MKWINWYFSGANFTPCVFAQSSHFLCRVVRVLQFSSVDLDHVRMFVSSTKPPAEDLGVCRIGSRVPTKNKNRIGDSVEPWGIPVSVGICPPLYVPMWMDVVLSWRNDSVNLVIQVGIPFSLILWMSLLWETLSKAPEMSRLSMEATSPFPWPHIVWTCSVRSSIADSVDLRGLAPICSSGNKLCSSAAADSLLAMIFSSALPIVLSNAIGLYTFRALYLSFYSFLRTMVLDSLNLLG